MINIFKNLILIILITTCFYLGLWQIDRAEEKLKIQNDFNMHVKQMYIDIKEISDNPIRYKKIKAKGVFTEPNFLLDNIIYKHKAGYSVISPFLTDNKILLVNRGWVDNYSRQKKPIIDTPNMMIDIKGYIKYPMKLLELSSDNITNDKPYIIQNINIMQISKIIKKEVFPYILNLNEGAKYSYKHTVEKNYNNHLKHYMYAGQWFLFTIIGIIFLLILNRRSNGKT